MAQTNDWILDASIGGLAQRVQLNAMTAALLSNHSGPTAPSPTVPGQLWFDTGVVPNVLRQRNAANTGWFINNPESIPAQSVWGNVSAFDAPMQAISGIALLSMLGFSFDNGAVKKQQIGNGMRLEGGSGVTGATGVTVTYSAVFAAPPLFIAYPGNTNVLRFITSQNPTVASITVQGWIDASTLTSVPFFWFAFGK